jgi:hypothetical protein
MEEIKNIIALDRAVCLIADNGDLLIRPHTLRYFSSLVLEGAALVVAWMWIRDFFGAIAILLLAGSTVVLVRMGSQPKVRIENGTGTIAWRRWFWKRRYSIGDVVYVEVLLDKKVYAWSAHLVDRRKKVQELKAILTLNLKDGSCLYLGQISGEHAERFGLPLAQTIADAIGVPVNQVGST